jgi:pimeloyl-ACP methyl ester carboxylesterase
MHFDTIKGSGPAVVLIHGLGASSFSWRDTVAALSGRFTTYAVDLLGFGKSAAPAGFAYTAKAQADAVLDFINAQHFLKPVTLIGHSMGGGVCLYLANQAAQGKLSLSQMVLVAPVASPPTSKGQDASALEAGAEIPGFGQLLAKKVLEQAYADPKRITPGQISGYAKGLSSRDQIHAFAMHSKNLEQISFTPLQLAQIKFKTRIIWGEDDPFLKPAATLGEALRKALPNAELELIKDCGHIPQEERPTETNKAIDDFLK